MFRDSPESGGLPVLAVDERLLMESPVQGECGDQLGTEGDEEISLRRSQRLRTLPVRFGDYVKDYIKSESSSGKEKSRDSDISHFVI